MALLRRPMIRRCSVGVQVGPPRACGAAGAPPGRHLRAGTLATTEERQHKEHARRVSPSQFGRNTVSTKPGAVQSAEKPL